MSAPALKGLFVSISITSWIPLKIAAHGFGICSVRIWNKFEGSNRMRKHQTQVLCGLHSSLKKRLSLYLHWNTFSCRYMCVDVCVCGRRDTKYSLLKLLWAAVELFYLVWMNCPPWSGCNSDVIVMETRSRMNSVFIQCASSQCGKTWLYCLWNIYRLSALFLSKQWKTQLHLSPTLCLHWVFQLWMTWCIQSYQSYTSVHGFKSYYCQSVCPYSEWNCSVDYTLTLMLPLLPLYAPQRNPSVRTSLSLTEAQTCNF